MSDILDLLPNLYIPGAAKSGTTTLHKYLSQHPEICMSINKEPNYLWRQDRTLKDYRNLFSTRRCCKFRGEASTSYMVLPEVVHRIKKLVPDPKFIFIFRNPVDRAWSHYWWVKGRHGLEEKEFRDALLRDKNETPSAKTFERSINRCYYQMGCYKKWLDMYFENFGRANVFVLVFEDFIIDPKKNLDAVCDFLRVARYRSIVPIRSNPTQIVKYPGVVRSYAAARRVGGRVVRGKLPSGVYRTLVAVMRPMSELLVSGLPGVKPPEMTVEDREWASALYDGEVEGARRITGLSLKAWERDFPLERD